MKKVLALVLAVMMLATVAFAADEIKNPINPDVDNAPAGVRPGDKIKINALGVYDRDHNYLFIDSGYDSTNKDHKLLKDINSTNYSITSIKYDDGKSLVQSVSFNDDDDQVEVKLKKDFSTTKPKKLNMTFTLKGKKVGKTKPADIKIRIEQSVNYHLDDDVLTIDADNELDMGETVFAKNTIYEVQKYDNNTTYGTLTFTAQGDKDVDVEVRVYDGDKLYLYNENDADDDILKAYADTDADITFLTFTGDPTFNSTATVRFYKEEDSFVYGVKDGKLVNVNAKWDDDEGCFVLKTRTLGAYVFSDKKLSVATPSAGSNNPDTGANDVVGIATALAAVALVSAAAVSLKK